MQTYAQRAEMFLVALASERRIQIREQAFLEICAEKPWMVGPAEEIPYLVDWSLRTIKESRARERAMLEPVVYVQ